MNLPPTFRLWGHLKQNADYCSSFLAKHTNQDQALAGRICSTVVASLSDNGAIQKEWLDNSLNLSKLGGLADPPPPDQMLTDKFTPVKVD